MKNFPKLFNGIEFSADNEKHASPTPLFYTEKLIKDSQERQKRWIEAKREYVYKYDMVLI